ncbi:MAG: hypothetical protein ACI4Q4_03270, partial [Oscillospiraceae bacterium]
GVSAVVKATPKAASIVPTNIALAEFDSKIALSWDEVDGASQYRIQRLNGTSWVTIAYPKTNCFTDTDLTNGTTYSYRILAQVDGTWSAPSMVVKATPKAATIVPQNVKAVKSGSSVVVTWDEVDGAAQYRVQRLNGSTWASISYPKTNSYTDADVTDGTSYSYRVLAQVDGVWSGVSAVATVS